MRYNTAVSRARPLSQSLLAQLPQLSDTKSTDHHLDATINWLYRSQNVTDSGGSSAGYNLITGWQEPYPETTGYIVPTLYRYASQTQSEEARTRATKMAEWLLSVQLPSGGFPNGPGLGGMPRVFNTGQILFGLVEAYRDTRAEKFREAAIEAADWLVKVQNSDGSWSQYTYNREAHAYHARVAWGLLVVSSLETERTDTYVDAAEANLEWVLNRRKSNGWFENAAFEDSEAPFLHTIAYTIRGLLEGGILLGDDRIFDAGKRSADVLLDIQIHNGILKGAYNSTWDDTWYYCLPGNAQVANIWLRLYEETGEKKYLHNSSQTVQFLKRTQTLDGTQEIHGGLPGSYPVIGRYMFLRYPNWGAKFLIDAFLSLSRPNHNRDATEHKVSPQNNDNVCRVCVLFDGEYTTRWVADAIETMLEETNTRISLVVINDDSGLLSSGNLKRGKKYPAYYLAQLGSLVATKIGVRDVANYMESVHISEITGIDAAPRVRTYPSKTEGLWNQLPSDIVEHISETSDVVFRRGFGLIQGDILSATQYGVLSYHHGNPRAYRGGPAGFWEFMYDEQQIGVMVQMLQNELDSGIVQAYEEIDIEDCRNWGEIRERIYSKTTHLLAESIENLRDESTSAQQVEDLGPVYHPPSAVDLGKYTLKYLQERV